MVYSEFEKFTGDAESLVAGEEGESFDYVEGFVLVNSDDPANGWLTVPLDPQQVFDPLHIPPSAGPVLYCLELALHHRNTDNPSHVDAVIKESTTILSETQCLLYFFQSGVCGLIFSTIYSPKSKVV